MTGNAHIVIVDDDSVLRNRLRKFLEKEGYRITEASDGSALRNIVENDTPDLALMDLQLPGEDGLSLTRFLRERTDMAVLILTGRGETVDRVVGLEMGADDYLSKPFSLRELLARIRSVLRRLEPRKPAIELQSPQGKRLRFGDWVLDLGAIELQNGSGDAVHLTTAEFKILEAFVRNPGRTLSRDQLIGAMAERSWDPLDRSIDLHISHLRRKIERDSKNPELIKTVRGFGYVFTGSPETV